MSLCIGVDLGGTTARAAIVERESGRIVDSAKEIWADKSPESVVAETTKLLLALIARHDVGDSAIGVGFAGMLRGSVVVNAPNLGWRDIDFGGALSRAVGRRVTLVNDLSAAAMGEFAAGAAKQTDHSFTVFVGTGVGSAIISNGRLITGASQVAGEFGHVKIVPLDGRLCGCGQHGCLEAYVGGARLAEWMKEEGLEGGAVDLERLAGAGNVKARQLYDFASGHLALAIANQVTVLNPGVLVLGGGVLMRTPGMVQRIRDAVATHATVASQAALKIEMAQLGDDSGLVGAAMLS